MAADIDATNTIDRLSAERIRSVHLQQDVIDRPIARHEQQRELQRMESVHSDRAADRFVNADDNEPVRDQDIVSPIIADLMSECQSRAAEVEQLRAELETKM